MKPAYFTLPAARVYSELDTSPSGLTQEEAGKRLATYGPNILPPKKGDGAFTIFLRQLKNPLTLILLLATVFSFALGDTANAIILIVVILSDISVGFIQEFRATKNISAMMSVIVPQSIVFRSGSRKTVASPELVPGDLLVLSAGDKIPADVRIIQAYDLSVDESLLTGESEPVGKTTDTLSDLDTPVADQVNMAFSGTVVTRGSGRGIVVRTGAATELGTIAAVTISSAIEESPLTRQFETFSKNIGIITGGAGLVVFLLGVTRGIPFSSIFQDVIAVFVAAIPEGLPLVVTAALAVTIQRMVRKKAVIRQLPAAETLGSCTVICTDKTGTLTKNEMTVTAIYDGTSQYNLTGDGLSLAGSIVQGGSDVKENLPETLRFLLTVGLLCNDSSITVGEENLEAHGDPTEVAVIVAAFKAGLLKENERLNYPKLAVLPFDSKRGFMATLHEHSGKKYIFLKGAPEYVENLCTNPVEDVRRETAGLAGKGQRVLAFAYKETELAGTLDEASIGKGYTFLGIAAMSDPPRQGVKEAIKICRGAGIRVIMITGDHATTAGAVAKELGITRTSGEVITGYELAKMSDEGLTMALGQVNVFARISPEQKLRIVGLLKKMGETVAVTGDGINDAPALKAAHIGVAMGKRGTDVSREVADMVIMDDNFATIVRAIEEARILFANIQKATLFLLPTGFAAIITVIATLLFNFEVPYTAVQLLWINLVTSGLQDVALAFEPGERGVLRKKPRKYTTGIMTRLMYERSIVVALVIAAGVLFVYIQALNAGLGVPTARTIATTTMVFFQFFQVANSRSETQSVFRMPPLGNPLLFVTMVLAGAAQVLALYWSPLREFLESTALDTGTILWCMAAASTVILAVELDKFLRKHYSLPFHSARN